MSIKQWPGWLTKAGIKVQTHNNFEIQTMAAPCINPRGVFWHHDASPPGYSPGALNWMIGAYNAKQPSAQIWVDYFGIWHFVGAGYASHAGVVRGPLTSSNAIGIETDHTSSEPMSAALLNSMRYGIAAVAAGEGHDASFMTFHKCEATPLGRKQDPYFEGNPTNTSLYFRQLEDERAIINKIIRGQYTPGGPDPEDGMSSTEYNELLKGQQELAKQLAFISSDDYRKDLANKVVDKFTSATDTPQKLEAIWDTAYVKNFFDEGIDRNLFKFSGEDPKA